MFVGDSLSLNQYISLLCLLHAAVPDGKTSSADSGTLKSVTFEVRISVSVSDYRISLIPLARKCYRKSHAYTR